MLLYHVLKIYLFLIILFKIFNLFNIQLKHGILKIYLIHHIQENKVMYQLLNHHMYIFKYIKSIECHSGHIISVALSQLIKGKIYLASGGTDHSLAIHSLNGSNPSSVSNIKEAHTGYFKYI